MWNQNDMIRYLLGASFMNINPLFPVEIYEKAKSVYISRLPHFGSLGVLRGMHIPQR